MISEGRVGKAVEGRGRGLLQVSLLTFTCRVSGNHETLYFRRPDRVQPDADLLQVRGRTLCPSTLSVLQPVCFLVFISFHIIITDLF
jgi:hypothetical protein